MPKKHFTVIATKQSQRKLLILLTLFAVLLSACGVQTTNTPFPQITQEALPVNVSVQVATFTPSPTQDAQSNGAHIQWLYALVAAFPTVKDGVTYDELHLAWTEGTAPAPFNGVPLLMEESTLAAFTALWDEPAAGAVRVVSADRLLEEAWSGCHPGTIHLRNSSQSGRCWPSMVNAIRKNFDLAQYPLAEVSC
jgi:hypothetical protein